MANMVAAFLGNAVDAGIIFEKLAIAGNKNYKAHLNKHHVVYIDFSEVPRDCTNYGQYIARIQDGINHDLARAYDDLSIDTTRAVWDIMTGVLPIAKYSGGSELNMFSEYDMATKKKFSEYFGFLG